MLKKLFTFSNAVLDLKGYSDEGEFVETYPFVPYQFRLMQNVLAEIRKHGNSGKHLSGGERSMLSGFQEAAQAIQDRDEFALMPFYLFYDTVHTFLESSIRRVIDRCRNAADNHDGIEQADVNILKLLYLVRYVDDIKSSIDNISILMADDIRTDKVSTRLTIQQSLDRLVPQNYVSRAGDTYTFLTDDEQDIAGEIKNTPFDSAIITKAISDFIFSKLFVSKKFKYGKYDFPYDQRIDETVIGQLTGSIALHFIMVASEIYSTDDSMFLIFEVGVLSKTAYSGLTDYTLVTDNTISPFKAAVIFSGIVMPLGYIFASLTSKLKVRHKNKKAASLSKSFAKTFSTRSVTAIQLLALTLICLGTMLGYMSITDNGKKFLQDLGYQPPQSTNFYEGFKFDEDNIEEFYHAVPPQPYSVGTFKIATPANAELGINDETADKIDGISTGTLPNTFIIDNDGCEINTTISTGNKEQRDIMAESSTPKGKAFLEEQNTLYALETKLADAKTIHSLEKYVTFGRIDIDALNLGAEKCGRIIEISDGKIVK